MLGLLAGAMWSGSAHGAVISEAEALQPPTRVHGQAVLSAAAQDGWTPQVVGLRSAALRAYERERLPAAEGWLDLARWAGVFGRSEDEFVAAWIQAVNAAKVGHANLPTRFEPRRQPLGTRLAPELQAWLISTPAFAAEFWALLAPVDYLPRVFEILDELFRADPVRFKRYASLALAIALVYDLPPPPSWPHAQVGATVLPRKLPAPAEAFAWWTRQDAAGRTLHKLARLGADELKFVVDTPATFKELEWAQSIVDLPLPQLARAYPMVRYRNDRYANNQSTWPGRTYRLPDLLAAGGICADQAYFASQLGKARGVPTLIFYGSGNDGRHAWFGYLGPGQKWQLDAGRYAEQRFVTGYARDPQTWGVLSDHELQFLAARFHALPAYAQSRLHAAFAAEYLAMRKGAAAGTAARKAVSFEKRHVRAWEILVAAAQQEGRDARTVENLLREAALAFQLYPDLEAHYVNRVAASLRARGDTSAADNEERRIALKNRSGRGDLSVQQARESISRAVASQPLAGQIKAYNQAVDSYGRGAGIGFFDEVVVGFVEHLMALNQKSEAVKALDRARHSLQVEPRSQLATEFENLAKRIREAR